MSKLPEKHRFLDLSDYGRPMGQGIAHSLKRTKFTPIHITLCFVVAGILAIICMLKGYYWGSFFFLVLKSILDAADGELARVQNTPSYTGRYLDSISDIILNFLFLSALWFVTDSSFLYTWLAFLGLQLQGTLYNYYYVILRNKYNGDTTSRIFEDKTPRALPGENQRNVTILFGIYTVLYGVFDKVILWLDSDAVNSKNLPKWFMTAVSTFGLGFQLLVMGLFLATGFKEYIIPFFIGYSFFILVFIGIRRLINR